jgi:hypothetical protein
LLTEVPLSDFLVRLQGEGQLNLGQRPERLKSEPNAYDRMFSACKNSNGICIAFLPLCFGMEEEDIVFYIFTKSNLLFLQVNIQ